MISFCLCIFFFSFSAQPIGITFTKYKSVDDESEESEESDEEDELRLDVEEIGFEEYIDQGDKLVSIFLSK